MASGWMQLRGTRRRRSIDRGFALSDHADWNGLAWAIAQTGAEDVWVTYGYTGVMVRWLTEHGIRARAIVTRFEGELDDSASDATTADETASGATEQPAATMSEHQSERQTDD